MPCTDGRDREAREEVSRRLNLVTRLLCEVMADIDSYRYVSDELREWWAEHQKVDAANSAVIEGSFRTVDDDWTARGTVDTRRGLRRETDSERRKRLDTMFRGVKP